MTTGRLVALGIAQCINWGALYYAFAVLIVPLQRELGVATWIVAGAFSLALLLSAAAAPAIGRWADRGHGPRIMTLGGGSAVVLLLAWTQLPGVAALYLVWAALGLCMAAALYEPAFVIVGRAYDDPAARLRALAAITLFGGLAGPAFLPATAFLVAGFGWRAAVCVLAIALAFSTCLVHLIALRGLSARTPVDQPHAQRSPRRAAGSASFPAIAGVFTLATLGSAALVTNLVPALGERGLPATTAAVLGGLMGAMQLPGRALLLNGRFAGAPLNLLMVSLALHASGLALVATGGSTAGVAAGLVVFALGAGVMTLARPHVVQTLFDGAAAGLLNGRIARRQQLARAVAPVLAAWVAARVGYAAVFLTMAGLFVAATLVVLAPAERKPLRLQQP